MEIVLNNTALLNLNLSVAASPTVTFIKPGGQQTAPAIPGNSENGFVLELETILPYPPLSNMLNTYLQGQRFQLSEGLINQYAIVGQCKLSVTGSNLLMAVQFSGSYKGVVYVTGKPFYDAITQKIGLQNFDYDLETNNVFLRGIKWLFDKIILGELKKYTVVDVAPFYKMATVNLDQVLQKEWTKGIQAAGAIKIIEITAIDAQKEGLRIRTRCSGTLHLTIAELKLKL